MPDDGPANLFAYPDIPRSGLGNALIPWARAEAFAERSGARILAPRWVQPKLGPILRRERDLRLYWGYFSSDGFVSGRRKRELLRSAVRHEHTDADAAIEAAAADPGTDHLVVFRFPEWGDNFFDGDAPHHRALLARRLPAILAPGMRARLERARAALPRDYIAIHVRRGDKKVMSEGQQVDLYRESSWVMRDAWYKRALAATREAIGTDAPAVVFSDGSDEQIADILAEPGTTRAPKSPSIVDILLLAGGKILIGTSNSSFSLWAALIADIPSVWYPGAAKHMYPGDPSLLIETTEAGEVSPEQAAVLVRGWDA
ncbi:MAG: hypothetical protein AAFR38_14530 [Planctomycetota bacterium]